LLHESNPIKSFEDLKKINHTTISLPKYDDPEPEIINQKYHSLRTGIDIFKAILEKARQKVHNTRKNIEMNQLIICISKEVENEDENMALRYKYTDGKIKYKFSHGNGNIHGINRDTLPKLLLALKENSVLKNILIYFRQIKPWLTAEFNLVLEDSSGNVSISIKNGMTTFYMQNYRYDSQSNSSMTFPNEIVFSAYEKIILELQLLIN